MLSIKRQTAGAYKARLSHCEAFTFVKRDRQWHIYYAVDHHPAMHIGQTKRLQYAVMTAETYLTSLEPHKPFFKMRVLQDWYLKTLIRLNMQPVSYWTDLKHDDLLCQLLMLNIYETHNFFVQRPVRFEHHDKMTTGVLDRIACNLYDAPVIYVRYRNNIYAKSLSHVYAGDRQDVYLKEFALVTWINQSIQISRNARQPLNSRIYSDISPSSHARLNRLLKCRQWDKAGDAIRQHDGTSYGSTSISHFLYRSQRPMS